MDLSEEEKKSLAGLKQALERKAGIKKDPLVAAKYFNSRHQDDRERVVDYATQLRKAFKELTLMRMLVRQCCYKRFCQGFVLLSLVR